MPPSPRVPGNREGHEFHSCRTNAQSGTRLQPLRLRSERLDATGRIPPFKKRRVGHGRFPKMHRPTRETLWYPRSIRGLVPAKNPGYPVTAARREPSNGTGERR